MIGCLATAASPWLSLLIFCREITGLGVGLASVVVPIYIAELTPKRYSGALGSWFQVNYFSFSEMIFCFLIFFHVNIERFLLLLGFFCRIWPILYL